MIDSLKNGQMIFSYYPDTNWLAKSPFIRCEDKSKAPAREVRRRPRDRRVAAAP